MKTDGPTIKIDGFELTPIAIRVCNEYALNGNDIISIASVTGLTPTAVRELLKTEEVAKYTAKLISDQRKSLIKQLTPKAVVPSQLTDPNLLPQILNELVNICLTGKNDRDKLTAIGMFINFMGVSPSDIMPKQQTLSLDEQRERRKELQATLRVVKELNEIQSTPTDFITVPEVNNAD